MSARVRSAIPSKRFLHIQIFGQNLAHGGADIGVDPAPGGDDRAPVGIGESASASPKVADHGYFSFSSAFS